LTTDTPAHGYLATGVAGAGYDRPGFLASWEDERLGEIGDGNGRGIYLQTVLAVEPGSREVVGCAYQHPFIRIPAPKGETRTQRRKRAKETDVWHQCAQHIGPSPASSMRVHGADRGADIFEFLHVCRSIDTHFVVRATQDRRVQTQEGTPGYLFEQIRSQPTQDQRPFDLAARPGDICPFYHVVSVVDAP
jgi:hypothetical protein